VPRPHATRREVAHDKEEAMTSKQTVEEVMTPTPRTVEADKSVESAAQLMAEADVGAVVVTKADEIRGILTDRDIVVRCIAQGGDCSSTSVGSICSEHVAQLSSKDTVDKAIALMAEKAIRRVPVVDAGRIVGILSLGDLALHRDPDSALASISAAPPNG
jgi:signal-transduction protein with cAMP-binding, CBS, and nucleotidyltransferase domain